MQSLRLNSIRDKILGALYQTPRVALLEELLRLGGHVHVLGGAVRDAVACGSHEREWSPRDFDIGVTGVEAEEFDDILSTVGTKNRHGGFVVREHGMPTWDVWRLENSIGLRKTGASFSLENVLRSFNLDCNAIALDVHTGIVTDAGATEAICRKRVGLVTDAIRHSFKTFAAKALLIQLRFGYTATPEVKLLVETHYDANTLLYESRKIFPQLPMIEGLTTRCEVATGKVRMTSLTTSSMKFFA